MARKTTYFVFEVEPSMTTAQMQDEFRAQGAVMNLSSKIVSSQILVELGDAAPAMFVVSTSGSPIDI